MSRNKTGARAGKHNKKYFPAFLLLIAVIAACAVAVLHFPRRVETVQDSLLGLVPSLTIEAGEALPAADEYLDGSAYVSGTEIDTSVPGSYVLTVFAGGKKADVTLVVEDTTAPAFSVQPLQTLCGSLPDASEFAIGYTDVSDVTFSYLAEPDVSVSGTVSCTVIAEDTSGNTASRSTVLTVCDRELSLEASAEPLTEARLNALLDGFAETAAGDAEETADNSAELLPGGFTGDTVLTVAKDGRFLLVGISVRDTRAPEADSADSVWYLGYSLEPERVLGSISDATAVTAEWESEPDWNRTGTQKAVVRLTDAAGNSTSITSSLELIPDEEAPTILAAKKVHICYVGKAVSYFDEVSAIDNADPDVTLEVDKSQVNPRAAGAYPVTYTATDRDGNTSTLTVTFQFTEAKVTQEQLDEKIAELFSEILTDDMTTARKIEAIYTWVHSNVRYNGTSDKTDWIYEAYQGLTVKKGDCFTSFSVVYACLQKLDGVQVIGVERTACISPHYWCLVNIGTGWYHVDAVNVGGSRLYRICMATTEQVTRFWDYYWHFDEARYPETATELFHDPDDPNDTSVWAYKY